ITPSTWIEFGAMFYGNISKDWSYALGFSQGLNNKNYLSGSWIRQGREIRFDMPKSISTNLQINYTGIKNLTLSASGYY
ncbi:porin, partial [Escherichia coli]|nr:porin [Escherichia coli]